MKALKRLFRQRRLAVSKWIVIAMLLFGAVGFVDAAYITVGHYSGSEITCSITQGCDQVLTSEYAVLFGVIPVSLIGTIFYLGMLIFAFATLQTGDGKYVWGYSWVTIPALFWMLYMVYLQLYVIHSICQYCMLSALTSTLLFILGMVVLITKTKER